MSRLNPQEELVITENPVKKYLTIKNTYTEEKIYSKGKEKIVKVLDSPVLAYSEKTEDEEGNIEYIKKEIKFPITFCFIDPNWTQFKGFSKTENLFYYTNEVNNNNSPLILRSKEGIVLETSLKEIQEQDPGKKVRTAKAQELYNTLTANTKRHNSLYLGLLNEENEIELVCLQLKGANLSGNKDIPNSGWWNQQKFFNKTGGLYANWFTIQDWVEVSSEVGDYNIINFTKGNLLSKEEEQQAKQIAKVIEKKKKSKNNSNKSEGIDEDIDDDIDEDYE